MKKILILILLFCLGSCSSSRFPTPEEMTGWYTRVGDTSQLERIGLFCTSPFNKSLPALQFIHQYKDSLNKTISTTGQWYPFETHGTPGWSDQINQEITYVGVSFIGWEKLKGERSYASFRDNNRNIIELDSFRSDPTLKFVQMKHR